MIPPPPNSQLLKDEQYETINLSSSPSPSISTSLDSGGFSSEGRFPPFISSDSQMYLVKSDSSEAKGQGLAGMTVEGEGGLPSFFGHQESVMERGQIGENGAVCDRSRLGNLSGWLRGGRWRVHLRGWRIVLWDSCGLVFCQAIHGLTFLASVRAQYLAPSHTNCVEHPLNKGECSRLYVYMYVL